MTTIVYDHRHRIIAVDSRICRSGVISSDEFIKYRYVGAELWFTCGTAADEQLLIDWFRSGDDKPKLIPECEAYVVVDGKVYSRLVHENGTICQLELTFSESIGSGSKFAISAIDHGKSAMEAVEYAATRDCYTGGKVHVYDIESCRFLDEPN
jgi:ATP-dependent protease HslVU (ClpYQ) peptidase subunit